MIDVLYINAFVQAVEKVFATMLQTDVTVREPRLSTQDTPTYDVSAIIGMSGDMVGVIILSFPKEVAERVASLFCGAQLAATDDDFADAIGELANMVSGNAKAAFQSRKASISCPTVVIGSSHQVMRQRDIPALELPCSCCCGDFVIDIAIKDMAAELANAQALSAAPGQD